MAEEIEEQVAGAHRIEVIPGERCEKFERMMSEGVGRGVIQIFSNVFTYGGDVNENNQ